MLHMNIFFKGNEMKYKISNQTNYLLIEALEEPTVDEAVEMIKNVREECDKSNIKKVLLDITQIPGAMIDQMKRFEFGNELVEIFKDEIKMAAFGDESDINHFVETIAREKGTNVKAFDDKETALNWLLTEESEPVPEVKPPEQQSSL